MIRLGGVESFNWPSNARRAHDVAPRIRDIIIAILKLRNLESKYPINIKNNKKNIIILTI